MPPKPQTFKSPDGKEFTSRAEWRDYMMLTFYSFKNKTNEVEPLIKSPGSISGQMFDIADCKNSTLVIMDHTEQVQIDQVENCRVFIGACASSIFIRNCSNCVFYTCCRQLRLRDVVDCKFYIYSMAEVHIEFSSRVSFAPFNGGYPEHAAHLQAANLDVTHNLWYDVYDHNDPEKTRLNWSLIPEADYEPLWFPNGAPCEQAIRRTAPGSVAQNNQKEDMQSFSLQQMILDAKTQQQQSVAAVAVENIVPPPPPPSTPNEIMQLSVDLQTVVQYVASLDCLSDIISPNFSCFLADGTSITFDKICAERPRFSVKKFNSIHSISISNDKQMAVVTYFRDGIDNRMERNTAIFVANENVWKLMHLHQSE